MSSYNCPILNKSLEDIEIYSSKKISLQAKNIPEVVNLSFGEPQFGPPVYLLQHIEKEDLTIDSFLNAVKSYEQARGCIELRKAIGELFRQSYKTLMEKSYERKNRKNAKWRGRDW